MAQVIKIKTTTKTKSGPSPGHSDVGTAIPGSQFRVVAQSGSWYKIKVGAKEVWVPSSACETVTQATEKITKNTSAQTIVIITTTKLRDGPSPGFSEISATAMVGSKYQVVASSGSWYKIKVGAKEGWIPVQSCTMYQEKRPPSVSTGKNKTGTTSGGSSTSGAQTGLVGGTQDGVNPEMITTEELANAQAIANKIAAMVNGRDAQLKNLVNDASMRLFGLPHQLIAHNDRRISSTSNLGRMFTETFILDAPIIYLKPGGSNYLPGLSKAEKYAYTSLFAELAQNNDVLKSLGNDIADLAKEDELRYFDFTQKLAAYISIVNTLCRIGAVFLDISDYKVPWINSGNATYGSYDWRLYTFGNQYNSNNISQTEKANKAHSLKAFVDNTIQNIDMFAQDDKYIQFYVDANTSYSESASNSTSKSALTSFTDQLTEFGKELGFVTGVSGIQIDDAVAEGAANFDKKVEELVNGNGAISGFLKRLTGVGSQLLAGSNFLAPDVWSDSDYGKNYNFAVTLATPYGTKEAWYLNIFVPLMHLLAMGLPVQTSANTYSAPFLVQAFAPGWFSCDMGIIDSISIEKGGSGDAWSSCGLPNEIKVSISIKDLYANLALPDSFSIKKFFNNTGLINFLMVNCGVDITKTGLSDKLGVFANLFSNSLSDLVKESTYGVWYDLQDNIRNVISLYRS